MARELSGPTDIPGGHGRKERAVSAPSEAEPDLEGWIPSGRRSSWPQVELEEAMVRRRAAEQTLGQRAKVWSLRAVLNLLILALLAAAFYGIFWATGFTVTLQVQRVLEECLGSATHISCGTELRSTTPGLLRGLETGRCWAWDFRVL